jgi:hypothetical protein
MPMSKTCPRLSTMFHMLRHIDCHESKYFRIVPQHPQSAPLCNLIWMDIMLIGFTPTSNKEVT